VFMVLVFLDSGRSTIIYNLIKYSFFVVIQYFIDLTATKMGHTDKVRLAKKFLPNLSFC
jgi:hypothetical protein